MRGHRFVRPGGAVAFALAGLACVLAAQARDPASLVCIAPDGVMRAPGSGGKCAANQTAVPLASPLAGACTSDPWSGASDCDPSPPNADDRLGVLEYRVKVLEQKPLFEVVDKDSHPIFQVSPGKAVLSTRNGDRVVELRAREAGGDLVARTSLGTEVALSVSGALAGLVMTENGTRRVEYGKQPAGNVSLRFLHGPGAVAAVGESQGKSGALVVSDAMGTPRALMSVVNDKGSLTIQNGQGTPVLALTEGATGGGLLVIGDVSGKPMVKFGVNEDRYGVVLAGPVSGFPLVPNSGMAGSYFLGCAGGDKCGPGGGGSQ
jgi:hypothetical protein